MQSDAAANLETSTQQEAIGHQSLESPALEDDAGKESFNYNPDAVPLWEWAAQLSAQVPDEEWEKLPKDLARRLKYYQGQEAGNQTEENDR